MNRKIHLLFGKVLYRHFSFKRPYLGNKDFFRSAGAKMTATSRAFTHSVVKVLIRPSFNFKGLVWRENLVPFVTKCDYNMPLGPIFDAEKKLLFAPPPKKSASNFCDLFHFTLSLIFTRTVAIWPFFVVFCFSIHTVNSLNLPPLTPGGGGCPTHPWG